MVRMLADPSRVRIGTWNVGSLTGKLREVVDTMIRRRVNILYVQEMKWKEQKAKEVEHTGFKLWYTGNTSTKNGVGIVLDERLKDGVVDIKRQGDRIILVKLLVGDLVFNVISAYAPQIGLNESVKMQFWEELDALVSSVSISEQLFIGDLNGHVGSTRVGLDGVHRGFGYGSRNQEGEGNLNFALVYDLIVANILFRKSLLSSNF
jgi:exonuclease III